jgi:DNA polymerase III subunit delta
MDALAFLDSTAKAPPRPVYVLAGDEDFLKRQVLTKLKELVLGGGDESFGLSTYPGDKTEFATVRDDLDTLPFLGGRRLIAVEAADPFVTRYRANLEKYVGQPSATGVLVLEVKTWPANTKLAKLVPEATTLTCKSPPVYRLPQWCVQWAASRHGKQLAMPAAQLLVDLVGGEMGQLDQELAKLATYVGAAKKIDVAEVDVLVGRGHSASAFKIFDAIGANKPAEALAILDSLFDQGEEPIRILAAFSMQLRRLAQAARLSEQGMPSGTALAQAGVPPFAIRDSEQQLRHIGLRRAGKLYDWLLEADLGMKGSSSLPPRTLLERLIVRLARPRDN